MFATQDYLDRHGSPADLADLGERSIIYYVRALLRVEDLMFDPDPRISLASSNVFVQAEMARAGGGIALLPHFVALRHPELVPVLPDEVRVERTFVAALAPAHIRRSPSLPVLDAIRREVRSRQRELTPSGGGEPGQRYGEGDGPDAADATARP